MGGFQHVLVYGVVPPQIHGLALLVELHEILVGPPLQLVKVPLDGCVAHW